MAPWSGGSFLNVGLTGALLAELAVAGQLMIAAAGTVRVGDTRPGDDLLADVYDAVREHLPGGIDGVLQRGMEWVQYTAAGLLSGAPRPESIRDGIRAAAPRPVLIIAGGAVADEPVAARWFQAAAPATAQVWVVPHAGHTQGLATAPQAWEAHVISFLNAALQPSPR